jgi:hypothetical protein
MRQMQKTCISDIQYYWDGMRTRNPLFKLFFIFAVSHFFGILDVGIGIGWKTNYPHRLSLDNMKLLFKLRHLNLRDMKLNYLKLNFKKKTF